MDLWGRNLNRFQIWVLCPLLLVGELMFSLWLRWLYWEMQSAGGVSSPTLDWGFWDPKFHHCFYSVSHNLMMVMSASGVAGVAAVKSFKGKRRRVLEGEKQRKGTEELLKRQSCGLELLLCFRDVQKEKKVIKRDIFLYFCISVFLKAVCTAFGNCVV